MPTDEELARFLRILQDERDELRQAGPELEPKGLALCQGALLPECRAQ